MSTENVVTAAGSSALAVPRREIEASFTGEAVSLNDCVSLAQKSKVTTLKLIRDEKVPVVGKVITGKRGRPGNLYDRDAFVAALAKNPAV